MHDHKPTNNMHKHEDKALASASGELTLTDVSAGTPFSPTVVRTCRLAGPFCMTFPTRLQGFSSYTAPTGPHFPLVCLTVRVDSLFVTSPPCRFVTLNTTFVITTD